MANQFLEASLRRWLEYLFAVLLGNAVYFWLLVPHLPSPLRHQPFRFDWGLALDFVVCVGVLRLGERLHRKSPKEGLER